MKRLLVIDVVGLTKGLVGENTPHLCRLASSGFQAVLRPALPAVTCTAQSTILTGTLPRQHGVVANGWLFRDLAQVWLWRQSNHLVHGEKVWHRARARDASFTCAQVFWWYNMYADVDWSVTPRPAYFADGRKLPDIYCQPAALRAKLSSQVGEFPLFQFWGPAAGLKSSQWIADAAAFVMRQKRPTLTLVYLPHLDYDLQRFGPGDPRIAAEVRAVDEIVGQLAATASEIDAEVIALSEYGITTVDGSVSINRVLRKAGLLEVYAARNGEILDVGSSRAFALSDHQVAHVYIRNRSDIAAVEKLLAATEGIETVLDENGKAQVGLDHPRSGELIAVSAPGRWFDYYYWLDDDQAPDFARTVDIHQKPGYDPVELFLDEQKPLVKLQIGAKLLARRVGFRSLLNVIPLTPHLVRGSHGRLPEHDDDAPVLISTSAAAQLSRLHMTEVADLMLSTIFDA